MDDYVLFGEKCTPVLSYVEKWPVICKELIRTGFDLETVAAVSNEFASLSEAPKAKT